MKKYKTLKEAREGLEKRKYETGYDLNIYYLKRGMVYKYVVATKLEWLNM